MPASDVQQIDRKMTELIDYVYDPIPAYPLYNTLSFLHNPSIINETPETLILIRPSAFESHPQIQPPSPHPTAFFLLDFIRNSHRMLKEVDAEKYAAGDNKAHEAVNEVVGRNGFANVLLNDSSGKLSMMTGGDPSNPVDFGPDIKAKSKALAE